MSEAKKIIVSTEFYGGSQGIDNILNDYYEREVRKIGSPEEQNLVRKFIEEGLIIDGNRVSVSEAGAINQFDISEDLLKRLRESRLVRAENTHLGKAYEVSHDTLVAPILKSFEKRIKQEEEIALAQQLKEEQEALKILSKKKRRANLLATLGFLLFFVALVALFFAVKLGREAREQTNIARSNELTAHSIFETQKKENVTKGFGLVKAAFNIEDNTEARKGLFSVFYKAVNSPSHYFYSKDVDCFGGQLLSAYYSPLGNYIIANSWNGTACLMDKDAMLIRTFDISADKPVERSFFSPDEKYLLTLSDKKSAEVWELNELTPASAPVAILVGHSQDLTAAAFSSDGQKVLTYANDGKVFLWNSDWEMVKQINESNEIISYANFSQDDRHILTVQDSGATQIRDSLGKVLKNINGEFERIYDVVFSPDSLYFAIASDEFEIPVYDWNGQLITKLIGHTSVVKDLDWSPNGKYIASTSPDKTVKIWDLDGNELTNITGHHASVFTANFSPDGTNLLTASVDNTSKVWTLGGELVATLSGHFQPVKGADYNPDGSKILSFSELDETVKEWVNEKNPTIEVPVVSEEVFKGKFSPHGKNIVTCGSHTSMLFALDQENGKLSSIAQFDLHNKAVNYVAFSPDEKYIATGSADNTAKIWDIQGTLVTDLVGHTDQIARVQWSPDSKEVVTGSHDQTAKVWSNSGSLLYTLEGHTRGLYYAAFSPDGKFIATTSADGTIKIWDRKGGLVKSLEGHKSDVKDAEFSPDGTFIVSASSDNTGRIWDLREGSGFGTSIVLEGHSKPLKTIDVCSTDGQYIVTASEDKTAIVWSREGKIIATLSGHESPLSKAIFSNNGKMIATSSTDNTAKVWTIEGQLISDMVGHMNSLNDVNFSPDDRFVLTSGSDHRAKIWPILTVEKVISRLENLGVAGLNNEMKKKYKLGEE